MIEKEQSVYKKYEAKWKNDTEKKRKAEQKRSETKRKMMR